MALTWDEVDTDEEITQDEQVASQDISLTSPVGKFLCKITEVYPEEKTFNAYSCSAAVLKMRIDDVIEFERVLMGDDKKPIMHQGEEVKKVQKVPEDLKKIIMDLINGQFIKDDVNLFHPKEKPNTKKRRLFVAKKIGILKPNESKLPTSAWPGAVGNNVIVTTAWNHWKDKNTGEAKKNVKVLWDGYEFAPAFNDSDIDGTIKGGGDSVEVGDTSFNTDEFDGI